MKLLGPSASEIMVKRYDVQDVMRYKADHRLIALGSIYSGMALGGLLSAGLFLVLNDVAEVSRGIVVCSGLIGIVAIICLDRVERGGQA